MSAFERTDGRASGRSDGGRAGGRARLLVERNVPDARFQSLHKQDGNSRVSMKGHSQVLKFFFGVMELKKTFPDLQVAISLPSCGRCRLVQHVVETALLYMAVLFCFHDLGFVRLGRMSHITCRRPFGRPTVRQSARATSRPFARPFVCTFARPHGRPSTRRSDRASVRPTVRATDYRNTDGPRLQPSDRATVRPSDHSTVRSTALPFFRSPVRPTIRSPERVAVRPPVRPSARSGGRPFVRSPVRPTDFLTVT